MAVKQDRCEMMPLPDEQQRMLARDVQYEIDEFRNSIEELARLKATGSKDSAWNRALESALLHFRTLRDFFYCQGRYKNSDLFATHYVSSWKPEHDLVFEATLRRIDKRLVHLTIERIPFQSDWPELDEMSAAIEILICKFKESLSPTKAAWFPRLGKSTSRLILGPADNSTVSGPMPTVGRIRKL
jgi:hypothetical protein